MTVDTLRRCIFRPYQKGMGPSFELHMWATNRTDWRGQSYLGYTLKIRPSKGTPATVLFEGSDFAGSPLCSDDSDQTIACLMGFLTLRPSDTDADYFKDYTPEQLDFCSQHAESLACEVSSRFGEY